MKRIMTSIVVGCMAFVAGTAVATSADESRHPLRELQARLTHVLTTEVRSASVRAALWPHVKKLDTPAAEPGCSKETAQDTHVLQEFFSNMILVVESEELDGADMYHVEMMAGYAGECMPWTAWRLVEEFCRDAANYENETACQIMSMAIAYEQLMPCPRYYRRRVLADHPDLWRPDVYEPPYVPPVWFMQSLLETVRRLERHRESPGAQRMLGPLANMLDKYYIQLPLEAFEGLLAKETSAWIKERILITLTYHPARAALALYERYYAQAYPQSSSRERRRAIARFRERVEQEEARQRSYTGSITNEVQALAAFKQQQANWDAQLHAMPLRTPEEADAFVAALCQYEAYCRDAGRSEWFRPQQYAARLSAAPVLALKEWYWRGLTQCMHQSGLTVTAAAVSLHAGSAFGAVLGEEDFNRLIRLNNALGTWDVIERKGAQLDTEDAEWRGVTKLAVLAAFGGVASGGRTNVAAALAQWRMEIFDKHVREILEPFAQSPGSVKQ